MQTSRTLPAIIHTERDAQTDTVAGENLEVNHFRIKVNVGRKPKQILTLIDNNIVVAEGSTIDFVNFYVYFLGVDLSLSHLQVPFLFLVFHLLQLLSRGSSFCQHSNGLSVVLHDHDEGIVGVR